MKIWSVFLSFFACCTLAIATDKTAEQCFRESHVFFDVQRSTNGIVLIGQESGLETFRANISFDKFTEYSTGNFYVRKLEDALYWQYQSREEFVQVVVNRAGDVFLMSSPQTYTGFDRGRIYGIKTAGTLENRGHQAFYNLILSANQIHNYGTIQSSGYHFFAGYQFNAGVIKSGERPTAVADLTEGMPEVTANPSYRYGFVDNYGKKISKGDLKFTGLSYNEYGESVMNNVQMSGRNITISQGNMNISGTLSGDVGDISVENNGSFYLNKVERLARSLTTKTGGTIYTNDEERARLEDLESRTRLDAATYDRYVRIKRGEIALNTYQRQHYERLYGNLWAEAAALDLPYGLKGGGPAASIVAGVAAVGIGIATGGSGSVGVSSSGGVTVSAGNSRKYRNECEEMARQQHAYREAESERQQAIIRSHMAQQSLVTEQQRVARNQDLLRQVRDRTQSYTSVRDYSSTHRVKTHPHVRVYEVLYAPNPLAAQHHEAHLRDRDFYSRLRSALESVHAERRDIATLWGDPYLNAVTHWSKLPEHERQRFTRCEPRTPEIVEAIDDARYFLSESYDFYDSPTVRYLNEYVIPTLTVASLFVPGPHQPAAAVRTAGLTSVRLIPALLPTIERVAVTTGVAAVYRGATAFFNENFRDGKDVGKTDPGSDRVQSTRQDGDRYLDGLQSKGVLSRRDTTLDGREFYKFTQKCNHNGVRFRKGDFISRDTMHHEWEWFRSVRDHRGAVNSITGKLDTSKLDPSRILRIK